MGTIDPEREKELVDRIHALSNEQGVTLPESIVDKAVEFIKFIIELGIDISFTVEPLPEGGIQIQLQHALAKLELDLYKDHKAELRVYSHSDELIARLEGEIFI